MNTQQIWPSQQTPQQTALVTSLLEQPSQQVEDKKMSDTECIINLLTGLYEHFGIGLTDEKPKKKERKITVVTIDSSEEEDDEEVEGVEEEEEDDEPSPEEVYTCKAVKKSQPVQSKRKTTKVSKKTPKKLGRPKK